MNIYEVIEKRRSVRTYKEDPVPEESLKKILEAGRLAPSAHNAQDYKFIVVKDAEKIKELAKSASGQRFFTKAPVIIVAVSLKPEYLLSSGVPAYALDLGIAFDHMTLAAAEEGLGTCWIGTFSQEDIKRILNIPDQYKAVVLLPIGFPDDAPAPKSRKKIEELISYENFSE
ncbi:MAG: nitroreductase [Candidatus Nealsonbacteria bacterium CG10_big_fil_rev_8_21_14_0_10_36_24]|uniref:Nitroreductase n=2 Tax=Candidatus Nealsoniibacteriota TaxID=1817911 RepID=A0A2H0YNH5_9BACT|nr:MAG: nitroreductase [Candidatus Nealsonbacteria bacterium CG10_big_fil_rev_8_21_14_0_10_36_24]PIS39819.1 MAG: nitroreductase [Candidatus Nealsonbacteria bacterium CG08_land_8_20_14_0_20_36_22]